MLSLFGFILKQLFQYLLYRNKTLNVNAFRVMWNRSQLNQWPFSYISCGTVMVCGYCISLWTKVWNRREGLEQGTYWNVVILSSFSGQSLFKDTISLLQQTRQISMKVTLPTNGNGKFGQENPIIFSSYPPPKRRNSRLKPINKSKPVLRTTNYEL